MNILAFEQKVKISSYLKEERKSMNESAADIIVFITPRLV